MAVNLENTQLYSWPPTHGNLLCAHSFGVHNYSKSFMLGEQFKSPTPGEVLLGLNNRFE